MYLLMQSNNGSRRPASEGVEGEEGLRSSVLERRSSVEWMMGYPEKWTVAEPWAMPFIRPKHGKRLKG